jgi:hypothetical protein
MEGRRGEVGCENCFPFLCLSSPTQIIASTCPLMVQPLSYLFPLSFPPSLPPCLLTFNDS